MDLLLLPETGCDCETESDSTPTLCDSRHWPVVLCSARVDLSIASYRQRVTVCTCSVPADDPHINMMVI